MKVSIYITFSKAMALIILLLGVIYAFINKDSEVFIFTISLSAGLSGLKSYSDGLTRRKEIDNSITNQSEIG